jgi:hypothetical protein
MTATQHKLEDYRAGNLVAAEIISSDPQKFQPGSLMSMWAEMVLQGGTNVRSRSQSAFAGRAQQDEKREGRMNYDEPDEPTPLDEYQDLQDPDLDFEDALERADGKPKGFD